MSSAFLPSAQGITAIRGFTGGAVSKLFDGTRVTTSTIVASNYDSWSFDRIEVLKGPASVLYGEGALAGAVNFVPKRPDFSARRQARPAVVRVARDGTAGRRHRPGRSATAAPRTARTSSWNKTDNYIDDAGSDNLQLNGAIDVKLGKTATLGVAVDHFRDDYGAAYFGTPLVPRDIARAAVQIWSRDSRGWVLDKAHARDNYDVNGGITDIRTTWVRTKLDWRLSPAWKLANELYFYDKFGRVEERRGLHASCRRRAAVAIDRRDRPRSPFLRQPADARHRYASRAAGVTGSRRASRSITTTFLAPPVRHDDVRRLRSAPVRGDVSRRRHGRELSGRRQSHGLRLRHRAGVGVRRGRVLRRAARDARRRRPPRSR